MAKNFRCVDIIMLVSLPAGHARFQKVYANLRTVPEYRAHVEKAWKAGVELDPYELAACKMCVYLDELAAKNGGHY